MITIPYDIKKKIMEDYLCYCKCEICKKTFSVNKESLCCEKCYIFFVIKSNIIYFKVKLYIFSRSIIVTGIPWKYHAHILWVVGTLYSLLYIFLFSPIFFFMVLACMTLYFYFLYLFIKTQ